MTKLLVKYPSFIEEVDFNGESFRCKNQLSLYIDVYEKIDEYTYKVFMRKTSDEPLDTSNLFTFIHDGKFCIFAPFGQANMAYDYHHMGFWKIPEYNSLFCEVSKNGCSTVVSEICNNFYSNFLDKLYTPEDNWVWGEEGVFSKPDLYKAMNYSFTDFFFNENGKDFENIFLVYDDPIKRFVRAMNDKYTKHHEILTFLEPPYSENLSDFIDQFILFTKLNLLNPYSWDQHIVPISKYHKEVLPYITNFVDLNNLNLFLKDKFNIDAKRYYASKDKIITSEKLSQVQIDKIKEIYKEDYQIPELYKAKFYR